MIRIRTASVSALSIGKRGSVKMFSSIPPDGTYHLAPHERTVIDPLHVAVGATDPDDVLSVPLHPESNAVPFPIKSKKSTTAHKENHDPELHEIALREFGKDYNLLNDHQKHQCAGLKGSAHKAASVMRGVRGEVE